MAHLHNSQHKRQPYMIQSIGSRVKHVAEIVALAKGAWDIGSSIYQAGQAIAPVAGAIGAALI